MFFLGSLSVFSPNGPVGFYVRLVLFFFPKQFTGWVSILEKRSLATLNRFEPGNGGYAGIILGSPVWSKKNQGRMAAWIAQYGGKDIRTDKQRVQYPLSPGTKR